MRGVLVWFIHFLTAVQLLVVWLALAQPAYAYVDPGSGLLAFQIVGTTFAGMIFILRRRLLTFLQNMTRRSGSKGEKAAK